MMQNIKKWLYIFLLICGALGLADTLRLCMYTNINVGTLLPGIVGLILVLFAFIKLWVRRDMPVIANATLRKLLTIAVILLALSFVFIEALIIYGGHSQENVRTDYVIILGAEVRGKTVSLVLEERLKKGVTYLNEYPDSKVVVSGGQGFGEDISEGEAMKGYLIAHGIDSKRIITEDKSTSTMENFKFSKEVLSKVEGGDVTKITVITNDFHMFRAKMLARRNGFQPYGISCNTPGVVLLNSYVREYFALIKSFLFDR